MSTGALPGTMGEFYLNYTQPASGRTAEQSYLQTGPAATCRYVRACAQAIGRPPHALAQSSSQKE